VPEVGWTRFNHNDSNLSYGSGWWTEYQNAKITSVLGATVRFNFVGDKIRIIGSSWIANSENIEISIDGKVETFSEKTKNSVDDSLVYEKIGLENGEHTVAITKKSENWIYIEAIDINEGGKLKPYTGETATDVTTKVGEIPVATTTSAAVKVTI